MIALHHLWIMTLQAAQQVNVAASTPVAPNDISPAVTYFTWSAVIFHAQRYLKTTQGYSAFVKAFPGSDKWAHRAVAAFGSLLAAASIHYVWNGNVLGGGKLTIDIPDPMSVLHGIGEWIKVYVGQATIYAASRDPKYQSPPAPAPQPGAVA